MASCKSCGAKAGMGRELCDNCVSEAAASKQRQVEQAAAVEAARAADARETYLNNARQQIEDSLALGVPTWLHKSLYIPVDAQMEDVSDPIGLGLRELNEAGIAGWEVVTVVPRTYSGSQSYFATSAMTMRDWGGQKTEQKVGLSGNVVGVYVLLRLHLTPAVLSARSAEFDAVIRSNAPG